MALTKPATFPATVRARAKGRVVAVPRVRTRAARGRRYASTVMHEQSCRGTPDGEVQISYGGSMRKYARFWRKLAKAA